MIKVFYAPKGTSSHSKQKPWHRVNRGTARSAVPEREAGIQSPDHDCRLTYWIRI